MDERTQELLRKAQELHKQEFAAHYRNDHENFWNIHNEITTILAQVAEIQNQKKASKKNTK